MTAGDVLISVCSIVAALIIAGGFNWRKMVDRAQRRKRAIFRLAYDTAIDHFQATDALVQQQLLDYYTGKSDYWPESVNRCARTY